MSSKEIRKLFLDFFKDKGHAVVPSSSLVPENDPTTLFTGSGMQSMMPYLLGESHPLGKRIADSQKCFRAEDIVEVGDNRHTTFFEMLGNWSFGDYWKEEQLAWFFEFLTEKVGLDPERLCVSVFAGGEGFEADVESIEAWKKLFKSKGIDAEYVSFGAVEEAAKKGTGENERIVGYDVAKNWWSRSGPPVNMPVGEPGGPDSEVFYEFTEVEHDANYGERCHPNCDCGRFLEIGNSVFMEFKKVGDESFEKLPQRNVDFGGGLERITMASNDNPDMFEIDMFKSIGKSLTEYNETDDLRRKRIVLDHMRAAVNLIGAGVEPSNKEQGYVLRRVLRRAIFQIINLTSKDSNWEERVSEVMGLMVSEIVKFYPDLRGEEEIARVINKEIGKFADVLKSRSRLEKVIRESGNKISGKDAFILFSTYGLPIDYIKDEAQKAGLEVDQVEFGKALEKHQEVSRTASAGRFKGGLADHSKETTKLHTAHHLLLKALQIVLGPEVKQRGSNITSERLRIDFLWDDKMTDEQKEEVERMVNEKIAEDLPVIRSEIALEEAEKLGAEQEFGQKYPERVSVYSIGPKDATPENPQFEKAFSIEFCGGPHVSRTGEIGNFKIAKEQASSAGVRRIRAKLE